MLREMGVCEFTSCTLRLRSPHTENALAQMLRRSELHGWSAVLMLPLLQAKSQTAEILQFRIDINRGQLECLCYLRCSPSPLVNIMQLFNRWVLVDNITLYSTFWIEENDCNELPCCPFMCCVIFSVERRVGWFAPVGRCFVWKSNFLRCYKQWTNFENHFIKKPTIYNTLTSARMIVSRSTSHLCNLVIKTT